MYSLIEHFRTVHERDAAGKTDQNSIELNNSLAVQALFNGGEIGK
jgi:hypothetical protein